MYLLIRFLSGGRGGGGIRGGEKGERRGWGVGEVGLGEKEKTFELERGGEWWFGYIGG